MNDNQIRRKDVIWSLVWKILERFFSQGVNLLVQIILARLLLPEDFGSLAIIMAIINYAGLFVQSGLSTALIQKKEISNSDINTMFTSSMAIALVLYVILFFLSPVISEYYNLPDIILPIRILSIIIFLNSIYAIQIALLSRKMQFKQMFYRSIIAVPISGIIGIVLAYMGFGLWSLVVHSLSNIIITIFILSIGFEYKFRFEFCWRRAKELYSFSIKILFSSLVSGFGDTLRTLIIGRKYSIGDLAYYDKAYSYSAYFTNIVSSSLSSVLLPTFSRSQENILNIRNKAQRSVQLTAFVIIPFLIYVYAVSEPLIKILLTDKWLMSVPFLQIFCLLRIPSCIGTIDKQVYLAMGNSKIQLKYELFLLVANVVMLLITVPMSAIAIAYGFLFVEYLGLLLIIVISSRFYNYSMLSRFNDLIKPILNSLIMGIVLSMPILNFENDLMTLGIKTISAIAIYVMLSFVTGDNNLGYILNVIKK